MTDGKDQAEPTQLQLSRWQNQLPGLHLKQTCLNYLLGCCGGLVSHRRISVTKTDGHRQQIRTLKCSWQ